MQSFSDLVEGCECLPRYLVHVVVLVSGQAPDEMYTGRGIGERLVLLINFLVLGPRHWIIRISLGLGKLVHDARLRMLLARQILEFGYPRIQVLIRVIHYRRGLVYRLVDRFVLEP